MAFCLGGLVLSPVSSCPVIAHPVLSYPISPVCRSEQLQCRGPCPFISCNPLTIIHGLLCMHACIFFFPHNNQQSASTWPVSLDHISSTLTTHSLHFHSVMRHGHTACFHSDKKRKKEKSQTVPVYLYFLDV